MTFRAIVAGSTGAIGRSLVAQLAALPTCTHVIALTRREIEMKRDFPDLHLEHYPKVQTVKISYSDIEDAATQKLFQGISIAFCCLGASRFDKIIAAKMKKANEDASGGETFRAALQEVDFEFMMSFGRSALNAGAVHFQNVSAMGAKASAATTGSMGSYGAVKGLADETAMNELAFLKGMTVICPGLLERGDLANESITNFGRPNEHAAKNAGMKGIPVQVVARAMIHEALQRVNGSSPHGKQPRHMQLKEIESLGQHQVADSKL